MGSMVCKKVEEPTEEIEIQFRYFFFFVDLLLDPVLRKSLQIRLFLKSDPIIGSDFAFFFGRVFTGARFSDPKIEVPRNPGGSGKNFFLF